MPKIKPIAAPSGLCFPRLIPKDFFYAFLDFTAGGHQLPTAFETPQFEISANPKH